MKREKQQQQQHGRSASLSLCVCVYPLLRVFLKKESDFIIIHARLRRERMREKKSEQFLFAFFFLGVCNFDEIFSKF
jgi:hypothetical protein